MQPQHGIRAHYFGTTGKANGSKAFDFAKVSPKVTDGSVTVTDDHFDLAGVEGGNVVTVDQAPKKFEYATTWPGETGKCIDYKNTAKFTSTDGEKGQDSETVTLCVEKPLTLDLDAKAAFDRDHDWKIEKEADKSSFNVDGDGNVTAGYKVTATEAGHADSNWKLGGTITVKNPNAFGEITATIGKTLSLEGVACTITGTDADKAEGFQVLVPAGASKVLAYDCDVASGVAEADYKDQTNVATATWGNGRTASSAVKSFDFALAAETDTEITVTDDKYTDNNHVLGTVTLAESPKVFSYDVEWEGAAGKCTTFTNTATIDGDTNHPAGNESSAAIDVCVEKGLTAVKTVDAGFTRDYDWKIAKEADKTSFTVDENGKAIADYTVTATQEGHNGPGLDHVRLDRRVQPEPAGRDEGRRCRRSRSSPAPCAPWPATDRTLSFRLPRWLTARSFRARPPSPTTANCPTASTPPTTKARRTPPPSRGPAWTASPAPRTSPPTSSSSRPRASTTP